MKNLISKFKKELSKEKKNLLAEIKEANTIKEVFDIWAVTNYLTKTTESPYYWKDKGVEKLKEYLKSRINKKFEKKLIDSTEELNQIALAGDFINGKIVVEWKKSRMWGSNPKAEFDFSYIDKNGKIRHESIIGSSIGGAGYDKQSTSVAEVLNDCKPLLKRMYKMKNKAADKKNQEVLGYGSGYGLLPRFEGGVGISAFVRIFDKLGYKFETEFSNKNIDIFKITKK